MFHVPGFQAPPLTSFSVVAPLSNILYNYAFSKVGTEQLKKTKKTLAFLIDIDILEHKTFKANLIKTFGFSCIVPHVSWKLF